jgi:excisionase family DNA binding protein
MMTVQYLTVEQAAKLLNVHEETVRRWIRAGVLPASKLVSNQAGYRIAETDIERLLREPAEEEAS